jgi:hypothetical protein
VQAAEIVEPALQVLQALYREQGAGDLAAGGPVGEQAPDVEAAPHDPQPAFGTGLRLPKLLRVPQRALEKRAPGPRRLELGDGEQGDVVALGAVGIVILVLGSLRHRGEDLESDVAGLEPRQIDLASARGVEQAALPEQGVGMHVGDGEPRMKRPSAVAGPGQRSRHHLVHAPLDDAWAEDEEGADGDDQEGEQPVDVFEHVPPCPAELYPPHPSRVMRNLLRHSSVAADPSPVLTGEERPKPKAWEVRVFSESAVQTLTSHRFAAGPSSPAKSGRGVQAYPRRSKTTKS